MTDSTTSDLTAAFGDESQLKAMGAEAQHMLAEARAGNWAVSEETGSHLLRAVTTMRARLSAIEVRMDRLQRAPSFGNDAYAQMAAQHFLKAMDSDDRSLVKVVYATMQNLDDLREAIEIAISKYGASDEAAKQHIQAFKD